MPNTLLKRPVWYQSLTFRIIALNMLGFLVTCLAFFSLLDRYQYRTLIALADTDLEDELLLLTSEWESLNDSAALKQELERFSRARGIARSFYRITDLKGQQLISSDLELWPDLAENPLPQELQNERIVWHEKDFGSRSARIIYYRFPDDRILQIGHDLTQLHTLRGKTRRMIALSILLVLLISGACSWFFTYRGLGGIRMVSKTAALIRNQSKMDFRVPSPTGSAETDMLAQAFNGMLDHLQKLMINLRYVMDNIAHDIKTPVTRMRGLAETELLKEDCKDPLLPGHVVEECDLILNLVNTLLQITAAESGIYQWRIEQLDLAALVRECCDLFEPVLEENQLCLKLDLPETLQVHTDGRVLQRVVANLLDNAIKYNNPGGWIQISLNQEHHQTVIQVKDSGIGIKAEDQRLIFDRFYRTDSSRTRPGNGLGLSFCKAAIEGLGGLIRCSSTAEGACFEVTLPSTAGKHPASGSI